MPSPGYVVLLRVVASETELVILLGKRKRRALHEHVVFQTLFHEPKTARKIMERAAEINPNVVAVQMNLGTAYAQTGDCKRAVKSLRAAIELGSKLGKVHYNLAACLTNLKEWDEALIHAQIAEAKGYEPATSLVRRILSSR